MTTDTNGDTNRTSAFLERLAQGPVLTDGAMGTELYRRGNFPIGMCFEELNLTRPDLVRQVHLDYIEAGAEIIGANTFGANRVKLEEHGLHDAVAEINSRAVALVREAQRLTGMQIWIAGAIGPLGKPLAPLGQIELSEARAAFTEQVQALVDAGVDLLTLETFPSLVEIQEAIAAARSVTDLPIIAHVTFTQDDHTPAGESPDDVLDALTPLNLAALGVNCSVGSENMLRVVEDIAPRTAVPLSALPNAGFPANVEDRLAYVSSPAYMAEYAGRMLDDGVAIIGGCCGTTPEHIAAMRETMRNHTRKDDGRTQAAPTARTRNRADTPPPPPPEPTELAKKMGKEFVVTVEVHPPRGYDVSETLVDLRNLVSRAHVDAFNATDAPLAQARLSPLAMSTLIQTRLGVEAILHMATRYRSLLALQSDLLGAHALGVRNVAVFMGDPPSIGDYPMSTSFSDVTSSGLVHLIKQANIGKDLSDRAIDQPTSFFVGCALNMEAPDLDREFESLERKVNAGCDFIWTQVVFDPEAVERCYDKLKGFPLPVVLGVLPLRSARHAEFLHNEVPGIVIPEEMRQRMKDAGKNGAEMGTRLAQELLAAVYDKIAGTYLIPSFGRYDAIADVIAGLPQGAKRAS